MSSHSCLCPGMGAGPSDPTVDNTGFVQAVLTVPSLVPTWDIVPILQTRELWLVRDIRQELSFQVLGLLAREGLEHFGYLQA